MPIKENNRHHDFEWEFERVSSDQSEYSQSFRYHQTDEYGPTVSVLDEDNNVAHSFPADIFQDVSGEIQRANMFNGKKSSTKRSTINAVEMPVIANGTMFKTGNQQIQQNEVEMPEITTPEVEEDFEEIEQPAEGFVSFSANNVEEDVAPPVSGISEVAEPEILSDKEIMEERGTSPEQWMEARKKTGKKKKSIKRSED